MGRLVGFGGEPRLLRMFEDVVEAKKPPEGDPGRSPSAMRQLLQCPPFGPPISAVSGRRIQIFVNGEKRQIVES